MAQMDIPNTSSMTVKHYAELRGVDYSVDKTQIENYNSPEMINMISDNGGSIVKRYGIRSIGDAPDKITYKNGKYYSVERGYLRYFLKELAWEDNTFTTVNSEEIVKDTDRFNSLFCMGDYLFAKASTVFSRMTLDDYTVNTIDITESVGAIDSTIVPTTVISLKPDGTDGVVLDDVNIFTPYQMNTFLGDASSVEYTLSSANIGGTVKAEILQTDGTWLETSVTLGSGTSYSAKDRDGTTYTETVYDGKVTFATAPPVPEVTGQDNVRITFSSFDMTEETVGIKEGFYNEYLVGLLESEVSTIYNSRVFYAIGERVYYSNIDKPNIVSDLNWFEVDDEVMGFAPFGSYLSVVCMENGNNTVFLASPLTYDEISSYKVEPTSSGIGAIAKGSFDSLNDEPMFVSNSGVYTLLTNWYSRNFTYNRSTRINKVLTNETNLQNAVCATCNNYYYIAINNKMYILDGRHRDKDVTGNTSYESYYFDNMPLILDMFVFNNQLFMVDDTDLYVFNDDIDGTSAYQDYGTLVDGAITGGDAVHATWCSKFDGDKEPQILKTLSKKGTMISIAPYSKTGVELTLIKDGDETEYVGKYTASTFSWELIDFSAFTFNANTMVYDRFPRKKIKKYKRLQIKLENKDIEPFGIIEVVKSFTYGNYAKR